MPEIVVVTLDVAPGPTAIWLVCAVTVLPIRPSAAELFTAVVSPELAVLCPESVVLMFVSCSS